ncbi:MAG: aspartate-semialdehyde dehydrogenase [Planctomycetota bacterium]
MTRVAVVGAGGYVGRTMLEVLAREPLGSAPPRVYGTAASRGKALEYGKTSLRSEVLGEAPLACDVALFAAGSAVAREWAPRFVEAGALVVDNSSAFRMQAGIPLVVPELNGAQVPARAGIVANPNCSTIILVLALQPLRALGNFKVVVSTYQAVSGAGRAGIDALARERAGGEFQASKPFPFPIDGNLFPLIGELDAEFGGTVEELKMVRESRKILDWPQLELYATCVRVPVERCHSESVTLIYDRPVRRADAEDALRRAAGMTYVADPLKPPTPAPLAGTDLVAVGRLRQPASSVLQFWLVGDQLLKGAALNAVQIARIYLDRR